jgi:hypothetical protein
LWRRPKPKLGCGTKERRRRGQVTCSREIRNEYNILVVKAKGKRPPGRPRRRLGSNIRLDLRKIVLEVMEWMHRLFLDCVTIGFSRKTLLHIVRYLVT